MGPTAIGKTDLAIQLYSELGQQLPMDIISVDSAMVYKGLNIGTGKPEKEILESIPHGLVDIREPSDIYSVADFCDDVKKCIDRAHNNHRIPLLVGGTMMYFRALQSGLAKLPSSDTKIREDLRKELQQKGLGALFQELNKHDPVMAAKLEPNDTQRVLRALEVFKVSGRSMSELILDHNQQSDCQTQNNYNFINLALMLNERSVLHKRIEQRFYQMLEQGFIEEVELLFKNAKLNIDLPAIRSCGYRQVWYYLQGDYTKEEMIERAIISTRQLAKRQCTWLRSWDEIKYYDTEDGYHKKHIINNLLALDLLKRIV